MGSVQIAIIAAGFPRWKSRYGTPSFTIPYAVKIKDDKLYVQKVGWLAIRRKGGDAYPDGEPVQVLAVESENGPVVGNFVNIGLARAIEFDMERLEEPIGRVVKAGIGWADAAWSPVQVADAAVETAMQSGAPAPNWIVALVLWPLGSDG